MSVPYYTAPGIDLYLGDCVDVMRTLPAMSVDAIITSPPYAQQRRSTYGGIPEKEYPEWTVAWMSEARRLLKPDGSVIINISPHKANGGLVDYVLRTRLAIRDAGWTELDELVWAKPNAMPTGAPNRPRRSWESLLWYGKHGRVYGNPKANGRPNQYPISVHTSSAAQSKWGHAQVGGMKAPDIARCSNVLNLQVKEHVGEFKHPAKFPVALAEWCGKLICPPGGTILDPFNGSGSTGVAAIRNGWQYVGIDNVEDYVAGTRERLERAAANGIKEKKQ